MKFLFPNPKIFKPALKIAVLSVVLAFFVVAPVSAMTLPSGTIGAGSEADWESQGGDIGQSIKTADKGSLKAIISGFLKGVKDQITTWEKELTKDTLKKVTASAYKAALKNFLNNLAYDMATYLATGDKGQLPMFQTQGWGGYLQNAADNAAGTFLQTLGSSGPAKFNLCNPNPRILLRISLGLEQSYRPSKPACTFSGMLNNWDKALQSKTFLNDFQDMFNPWSNDLGIALSLQSGMTQTINEKVTAETLARQEGAGFKAVTDDITGYIKTPARTVMNAAEDAYEGSKENYFVYTGEAVADSIDIFLNTLIGKLINKWLKQGLVTKMPSLTSTFKGLTDNGGLSNASSQNQTGGVAEANERMSSITEPDFRVRADYDILAALASCPNPNKAGPTNCVIDEKFRQAIEKKMTVGQALKQGYLNGNGIFGFTAGSLEPKFNEGYPYRSMIILRKYRIIPVGWEVAAQKIVDRPAAEIGGTKNLNYLVNCFSAEDDYGAEGDVDPWCLGLVDPDWVLKAPENFCKREGAGGEVISEQVSGTGSDSAVATLRNDAYCADEQSCIKEKTDGSCQLYGYCTEERRKWDFNAESCEPRYNTCQTFSSPSAGSGQGGETVSYLENSLDYGKCNAGNVGCLAYCQSYDRENDKFTCTVADAIEEDNKKIYLDNQAEECDQETEGCHQLIRLNPGGGANLLINSGFEKDISIAANGGWDGFGVWTNSVAPADPDLVYQGSHSLQKDGSTIDNIRHIAIGPAGYKIAGESYVLSFYAKDCAATGDSFAFTDAADVNELASAPLTQGADWVRFNLNYTFPINYSGNQIHFKIQSESCLIDNIKLETGAQATAYTDYASASSRSLIYEKLMPAYLADGSDGIQGDCYKLENDSYVLKEDAPAECLNFSRRCSSDEVGCELYTGVLSGVKIPAKVSVQDYCPAECLGYDTFIQSATLLDSLRPAYFIPRTAKTCSAEAAGCDEFTNLEKISTTTPNVAEKKEYYSYLRQCVKPGDPSSSCAEFYYWEGSDESGFQLKVAVLKAAETGASQYPVLTGNETDPCNELTYNLPTSDPGYSSDCRQFYNRAGGIFYRSYSRTFSCTEDCHPYRRTEVNIDVDITTQGGCGVDGASGVSCSDSAAEKKEKCWDAANQQCVVCKNGGEWSVPNQACIYNTVISQSQACSAAQNGCREYTGNTGNDVRNIFTDDFSGGLGVWTPTENLEPSSEAYILDSNNKGSSLKVKGTYIAQRTVGSAVTKGKSYVLSFLAKTEGASPVLNISLTNSNTPSQSSSFATVKNVGQDWLVYRTNLISLDHEAAADEYLKIEGGGVFYLDNVILTEIVDRYYLIKNSWQTPAACNNDIFGAYQGPLYNLGCAQYQDRAGQAHNLRQFSKLCSESAAGCELMIDTHNSSDPGVAYYNDGDKVTVACDNTLFNNCVKVEADSPIYAVYDAEKLCGADAKGCEFLGRPYTYDGAALFSGVYLENDPDKYNQSLCGLSAVGCQAFAYSQGEQYFKDPGDQACEYRLAAGQGEDAKDWFKKKVKRCDDGSVTGTSVNGVVEASGTPLVPKEDDVCLSDSNCSIVTEKIGVKCSSDNDCRISGVNVCTSGKCSITGNSCTADNNCSSLTKCVSGSCHYSCLTDNNDYKCQTSNNKTFGYGGAGNSVYQPAIDYKVNTDPKDDVYWAGLCPAAQAGCTEYLDPVSKFNPNLIFNGGFQIIATARTDGWATCVGGGAGYCQNINLDANTVYRLRRLKNSTETTGELNIKCNESVLREIGADNALGAPTDSITVSQEEYPNSKSFYYQGEKQADCKVSSSLGTGSVELKQAVVDYQLSGKLDKKSCNGIVDFDKGCVLFNERKQAGNGLEALKWDADITDPAGKGAPPEIGASGNQDSNALIKVSPDRTCNKWLACKTYIKDQKGDNVCFDLGLCDAVDDNGNCSSFLISKKVNQTVDGAGGLGVQGISNLSGYAKVGIAGGSLKSDYYPLGAMEQNGDLVYLANGGFEFYGANLYPVGWNWSNQSTSGDKPWSSSIFSVVNNPIAAQTEGTGFAPEGQSFIKLGSSYQVESEELDVMPNTEYIITAYVNTINLKNGQARISVEGNIVITQDKANGWKFQVGSFNSGGDSTIKIVLYSTATNIAGSEGNFYFDDIKIRPVLKSRDNFLTPQTCRLYPKNDSRSCDYYEESGARQKGWPGYCLEYDRRPGNSNVCLLWYPVDKVKGDGIEEGAGYLGRAPLYYCLQSPEATEDIDQVNLSCGDPSNKTVIINGVSITETMAQLTTGKYEDNLFSDPYYITPDSKVKLTEVFADNSEYTISLRDSNSQDWSDPIPETKGANNTRIWDLYAITQQIGWDSIDGIRIYCVLGDNYVCNPTTNLCGEQGRPETRTCDCKNPVLMGVQGISKTSYCDKIVQVVTPSGQNKYWSSRVYQGSDYQSTCTNYVNSETFDCGYDADYWPFGSVVYPAPASNPYEWDSKTDKDGTQPLYFEEPDTDLQAPYQPRAGQLHSQAELQQLFAKSYGMWTWNNNPGERRYETAGGGWDPPKDICVGARGDQYCANLPTVTNIKVDGQSGNVVKDKTQFIKLTFNTQVDSQQQPMVMYGVNWGDNSQIVVSGAQMHDRPDPDPNNSDNNGNPEEVYHLYSYWDLKAKDNTGGAAGAGIDCWVGGVTMHGHTCPTGNNCCGVQPKIQIKDNWGWCNHGETINVCENTGSTAAPDGQWDKFGGYVIVTESGYGAGGGSGGVCIPDGNGNGNCPANCTAAEDSDCGGSTTCTDNDNDMFCYWDSGLKPANGCPNSCWGNSKKDPDDSDEDNPPDPVSPTISLSTSNQPSLYNLINISISNSAPVIKFTIFRQDFSIPPGPIFGGKGDINLSPPMTSGNVSFSDSDVVACKKYTYYVTAYTEFQSASSQLVNFVTFCP